MRKPGLPPVPVKPQSIVLQGGLDLISGPGQAYPGACRYVNNYEQEFGGGYRRVGGIERFSGQPAPHLAEYTFILADDEFVGAVIGDTLTGATSGTTGEVIYVTTTVIAVTKIVGTGYVAGETVEVGASPVGVVSADDATVDGFLDNQVAEAAANVYRVDIDKPAGEDGILGVAVLNDVVYCWRKVGSAMVCYKETVAGWVAVPLYSQISFTLGTIEYAEGTSLVQGGSTATVKRVVLESGSWSGGTAAGRLIILPVTGTFTAGAAGGSGAATLSGAATAITQLPGGRVVSVVGNFTASLATKRLYCCDGVNQEWEFDGDVAVPIATGMGNIRATDVYIHKNHLFYAYRTGVQHSGLGFPYIWSPVFGAAELGTGDTVTNLIGVSGSESNSALMVLCKDSAWVLYGSSSADWDFRKISQEAGAQPFSAQEAVGVLAFDRNDFRQWKPTQAFGNFQYESASRQIEPLVRGGVVLASVLVKDKSKYRIFFNDGMFLTATPGPKRTIAWMPCDYGRVITCAVGAEIDGEYRVFMGDADGWVYEADVGRSFDGDEVTGSLRLCSVNQGTNATTKQYRHMDVESEAESAFGLAATAEFSDSEASLAAVVASALNDYSRQYGTGLFYDFNSWDRAYWDVHSVSRVRYPVNGNARSLQLLFQSEAADQLPHTLKVLHLFYTPRRLAR